MYETVEILTGGRRALRRSVRTSCEMISDLWHEPVPHDLEDLSVDGAFAATDLPLEPGSEVVISMVPPGGAMPLYLYGEVARVRFRRREADGERTGMGIRFRRVSHNDRERLRESLRGLPPPLPSHGPSDCDRERLWVETLEA